MKKWYSCYVASCGIVAMILWLLEWIVIGYPVLIVELILCNIVIWKLAPCVHEDHSLEDVEMKKAKMKAIRYSVLMVDVYTENANGEKVPVGYVQSVGKTNCSVDQTSTGLPPVGTYSVKKITVQHTIYDEENTIVYYIKRSESY